MSNLVNYSTAVSLILLLNLKVSAQRYDNTYRTTDASILQVFTNNHTEQVLKGATAILPNGSNQLNISLRIPYEVFRNQSFDNGDILPSGYQFSLKIDIDPMQIQDLLTSTQTFCTQGFLTLNSITKPVMVSYIPMVSGTDENGNFKIFLNVQFNADDFGIQVANSNAWFSIKINNAKVNRV